MSSDGWAREGWGHVPLDVPPSPVLAAAPAVDLSLDRRLRPVPGARPIVAPPAIAPIDVPPKRRAFARAYSQDPTPDDDLALDAPLDPGTAWERRAARLAGPGGVLESLTSRGWHDISPFWRQSLEMIYARRPRIVPVRVGRRGGKSSTSCRVAVAECTARAHFVPPGDIGVFHVLSADRDQAKERVKTCVDICEALGIEHAATAAEVRFPQYRTAIRVTTASVRAAVSSTSIGALFDEMAHWQDDRGSNPAADILRAFKPSVLTMPGALLWLVSAPWTTRDAHAQEYDKDARDRLRLHAPTWIANPTTTEADCRDAAEDEIDFLRNYAAVPCDIDNAVFFPSDMIEQAIVRGS